VVRAELDEQQIIDLADVIRIARQRNPAFGGLLVVVMRFAPGGLAGVARAILVKARGL